MAFLRAPLQEILFPGVWFDLVPHATEQIGGGFRGHYQGSDHGGWDLPQDAAHGTGQTLLFMAAGCYIAQGLSCVNHSLESRERVQRVKIFSVSVHLHAHKKPGY